MTAVKCKRCGKRWGEERVNRELQDIQIVLPKGSSEHARVFICPKDGHPLVLIWKGFAYSLVLEHGTANASF